MARLLYLESPRSVRGPILVLCMLIALFFFSSWLQARNEYTAYLYSDLPLPDYYAWNTSQHLEEVVPSQQCLRTSDGSSSASAYRQALGTLRASDTAAHSRTLGVANAVYVVHMARRADRRVGMEALAAALDIDFTWHDATDFRSSKVQNVFESVRAWRNEHRRDPDAPRDDPTPFVFEWAEDVHKGKGSLGVSGADLWIDGIPPANGFHALPAAPNPDERKPILDMFGENGDGFFGEGKEVTRAPAVACWISHYEVLRRIAEGPDDVAIVLEDDVDMEFDIERRLQQMWRGLPSDWDIIFLGHCQGNEHKNPPVRQSPSLRISDHPLCTHAYAVNKRSAQHLVRRLRTEAFAFSRPIDHAFKHLFFHNHITAYSVYPAVVVQTYDSKSDIAPGNGGEQAQFLVDSTRERIEMGGKLGLESQLLGHAMD